MRKNDKGQTISQVVGARSELIACAWLLECGYEVFRNVSPVGMIDIVAYKDGEIFLFDIKTGRKTSGAGHRTPNQKKAGIRFLYVSASGNCTILDPESNQLWEQRRKRLKPKTCPVCLTEFKPLAAGSRYCSRHCFNKARKKVVYPSFGGGVDNRELAVVMAKTD